MKNLKRLLWLVLAAAVVFTGIYLGKASVKAASGDLIPTKEWGEEEWNGYKDAVIANLKAGEFAFYITLDGKPMTGYDIYQANWVNRDENLNMSKYKKAREISGYPGVYILNTEENVFIYESGETKATRYKWKSWMSDFDRDESFYTKNFYTVTYEQGDIDCKELPEREICLEGKMPIMGYESDYYGIAHGLLMDGYNLAGFKDSDGELVKSITKTTVLHPFYVAEDNTSYDVGNTMDNGTVHDWRSNDAVTVRTGAELVKALSDEKNTFVYVEGNLVFDDTVTGNTIYSYQEERKGYLRLAFDCIIVKNGAKLTFRNATVMDESDYYGNASGKIVVEAGGTLEFNKSIYEEGSLVVKENATLNLIDSTCSYSRFHNWGTVNAKTANPEPYAYYRLAADGQRFSNDDRCCFFNGAKGTINMYNNCALELSGESDKTLINVNRGSINICDEARFELEGSSSQYQTDRTKLAPFINDGTINVKSKAAQENRTYYFAVRYTRLLNNGQINFTAPVYTTIQDKKSAAELPYMYIYESELYNAGNIIMDTGVRTGIKVEYTFFDPEKLSTYHDEQVNTEKIYSTIYNLSSGTIDVTTGEGKCGIFLDDRCVLDNAGTIKLNTTVKRADKTGLLIRGKVANSGKILGEDKVACDITYISGEDSMIYPAYTGTAPTAPMAFAYDISLEKSDYDKDPDFTTYTITADATKIACKHEEYYGYIRVYLPSGEQTIKVSAAGFQDAAQTIEVPKTVKDYHNLKTEDRDWRFLYFYMSAGKKAEAPLKTNVKAVSNVAKGLKITWAKNSTATGYVLYRSDNGGEYRKLATITSASTVSYTDKTATKNGTKYQYRIKTYKTDSGKNLYADNGTAKTCYRLEATKLSSVENAATGITVKWAKNAKATGYYVYRSVKGGSYSKIATIKKNATVSYADKKATTADAKYQYKIIAYKTESGTTYQSVASEIKTIYRVAKPTIASTKNTEAKKVTVTWKAVSKASGYEIKYVIGKTTKTFKVKGAKTVSKVLSSLKKGKTYKIYVRAYKTVSKVDYYSAWSSAKSIKVTK